MKSFNSLINPLTLWQATVEASYQQSRRKHCPIIRLVRMGYEDGSFRLGLFLDHEPIGEPTFTMLPGPLADEMKAEMIAVGQKSAAKMAEIYQKEWAPLAPVAGRRA